MNLRRNVMLLLLGAVTLSLTAAALPTPAAASKTGDVIVGAIIGGLIGAALSDDDHDRYHYAPGYYDRGPVYVPPGPYGSHWTPRYAPVPGQRYRYSEVPRYAPPPGHAYGYTNGNAYGHCDDGRPGPGNGHAYGHGEGPGRDHDYRR